MKQIYLIALALLLTSCGGGGGGSPAPVSQPLPNSWVGLYGTAPVNPDGSLTFGEPHYVVKAAPPLAQGQTITIKFRVDGTGTLVPSDGGSKQALLRLFLWERGDNLSCAGAYQEFRIWSGGVPLIPGQAGSLSVVIDPANWTDCYGQHPNAQAFAMLLANAYAVGYTFGGSFAGHGVDVTNGTATFTLLSFTIN